jgi:integrase
MNMSLKYVQGPWIDELGRTRCRFRRKGHPGVELPDPNSPQFLPAYFAALHGQTATAVQAVAAARAGVGTVESVVVEYLASVEFRDGCALSTQNLRRPILKKLLKPGIAELPIDRMDSQYLERWLGKAATLGARNTQLLALRQFFDWCVDKKFVTVNPVADIKKSIVPEGVGHHTMQPEEIKQYRDRHPIGSMARLALELGLTVLTRRGDCISLGPKHIKADGRWIEFVARKNKRRKPTLVSVPVQPELAEALAACPTHSDTFLHTTTGRPFTERAFNEQFRQWCDEAGLSERVTPHSMRKGGSKHMADSGCNEAEITAQGGWHTSKEVLRYTRDYDRRAAVVRAAAKLAAAKNDNVITLPVKQGGAA